MGALNLSAYHNMINRIWFGITVCNGNALIDHAADSARVFAMGVRSLTTSEEQGRCRSIHSVPGLRAHVALAQPLPSRSLCAAVCAGQLIG